MSGPAPEGYCYVHDSTDCADLPHPHKRCTWCHGGGRVSSSIDIFQSECPCRHGEAPAFRLLKWERKAYELSLSNLAANIATAGGLCEAFELGHSQANHEEMFSRHGYRCDEDWRPGCQRSAP